VFTPDRSSRLQQVADYRTVRKTLKNSAVVSLIFGAITLFFALLPPFSIITAALGVMLLATGAWNLARPRPTGILVDGVAVIVVGLFNLVSSILDAQSGQGASPFWIKMGIFQLIIGGQSFWRFAHFRDAFKSRPADSEMQELDGMVSSMWKSKVKETQDVIEFKVSGFHETPWKARLTDSLAVLATLGGNEVKVASRAEFDIAENGKVLIGKSLKATFTIRGKAMKGTLSPESFERFQFWKTGVVIPRAIAA
jgi:membrane-bound ClpP family serine protease